MKASKQYSLGGLGADIGGENWQHARNKKQMESNYVEKLRLNSS